MNLKCYGDLDEGTIKIYEYIKENKIINSEIMCEELKMNIQDVNMHLTILELKGCIINKNGNNFIVRDDFLNV